MAGHRRLLTRTRSRAILASAVALPALIAPILWLAPAAAGLGGGDDDSDGIPNSVEGDVDTDGDGFPDRLDRNSDGDALPDAVELTEDRDNDGVPDYRDADRSETTATVTEGPDGSTITADGFGADAPVTVMSDPGSVTIGSDLSDGSGRVSVLVTIPTGATDVTVVGYGPDGGVHEAKASLGGGSTTDTTLAGPEAPATSTTTTTEVPDDDDVTVGSGTDVDDELAMTGPSAVVIEAIAGSSMLSMGGGLTLLSKRLSRRNEALPAIARHQASGRNYTAPDLAWPPADAIAAVRSFFTAWLARSGDPPARRRGTRASNSPGRLQAIRSVWPRGPDAQPEADHAAYRRPVVGLGPAGAARFGFALV